MPVDSAAQISPSGMSHAAQFSATHLAVGDGAHRRAELLLIQLAVHFSWRFLLQGPVGEGEVLLK